MAEQRKPFSVWLKALADNKSELDKEKANHPWLAFHRSATEFLLVPLFSVH